jgi:hypothetical protein
MVLVRPAQDAANRQTTDASLGPSFQAPRQELAQRTTASQTATSAAQGYLDRHPRLSGRRDDRAGMQVGPTTCSGLVVHGPGHNLRLGELWQSFVVTGTAFAGKQPGQAVAAW